MGKNYKIKKWLFYGLSAVIFTAVAACSEVVPAQPRSQRSIAKLSTGDLQNRTVRNVLSKPAFGDPTGISAENGIVEIIGVVSRIDGAIVVATPDWDYFVAGKDLSGVIGKRVKLTGMLQEDEDRSVITVITVETVD